MPLELEMKWSLCSISRMEFGRAIPNLYCDRFICRLNILLCLSARTTKVFILYLHKYQLVFFNNFWNLS